MKARKNVALGLAAAMAATTVTLAAGGAAQAYGPTSSDLHCRLYFGDTGTGTSPSTLTDTYALTQSPVSPAVGDTVTLTLTGATGPATGPIGVAADSQTVRATVDLSGAQTATVTLVSGAAYPAAAIGTYTPLGAYSASGTYVASTVGSVSAALKQVKFDDDAAKPGYSTYNVDTYCTDAPDSDVKSTGGVASTTIVDTYAQVAPSASATITAVTNGVTVVPAASPAAFRTGDTITVSSGANALWTPSTAVNATICGTAIFVGCAPLFTGTLTGAVAADATGAIPTSTLTAALSTFTGAYYVALFQGADVTTATNRVAIPVLLLGTRTALSSTAQALKGSSATVSGTGWYPGETVNLTGSSTNTVVANSTGAVSKVVTLSNGAGTQITATGIGGSANAAADVVDLNGTFAKSASSIYATQSVKVTPSAVTADVNTLVINWGDGTTTTTANKTAAVSHAYPITKVGTRAISVTLKHTASNLTVSKAVGSVAVVKDSYKPVPTLTVPSKSSTGSSWKTIKGKVTDKGLGAKSVTVRLVEKRGSAYYAWTGTKWVKKSTKAKALAAAKKIVDTTVSAGWSVKGATAPKGTLYVTYYATDKANNSSTSKTYTKSITK